MISLRRKPAPRNPPPRNRPGVPPYSRFGHPARLTYDGRRALRQGDIGLASDALPLVFTGRRRNKLIVLAFGIALTGIGIMMIFDQAGGLVGRAGPFRHGVLPSGVGWGVCGIGLVFTVVAVFQLARGCPRLELNDEGILYSRCLQAT